MKVVEDNGLALVPGDALWQPAHRARAGVHAPPFHVLGWKVTDIAAEVQALTAADVVFEQYPHFEQDALGIRAAPGGAKVAWFKDPDGNTLALSQA